MYRPFNTIGIVGVGLIGGSLGLALKKSDPGVRILGIGRDAANLEVARRMGAVDAYALGPDDSLSACDLVILATPVEQILASLPALGDRLKGGTLVTDVGSTKRRICEQAWSCLPNSIEFIGGHPVAGREVSGVENSLANLFDGAPYVLCPRPGPATDNLSRLRSLVEQLGAKPIIMDPGEHDQAITWVSHLPQLLSTALANVSAGRGVEIAGSGFRDMIRLAASPYSVWKGIVESNTDNIDAALKSFIEGLERMRLALKQGRLSEEFESAAAFCKDRPWT